MFDTNFFATQTLLAKSARWMLDRGQGGHLLACSSCVSKFAAPWYGGYAATKAAQDLLCQAMRPELAPHGIAVSTVHPIGTETEFSAVVEQMSDRRKQGRPPTTPKWLTQKAHQVGEAVVRCLRRPRPEVWTSLPTRFVGAARQLWPRMLDRKFAAMVRAQQP